MTFNLRSNLTWWHRPIYNPNYVGPNYKCYKFKGFLSTEEFKAGLNVFKRIMSVCV